MMLDKNYSSITNEKKNSNRKKMMYKTSVSLNADARYHRLSSFMLFVFFMLSSL